MKSLTSESLIEAGCISRPMLSKHAQERMKSRHLPKEAVVSVLEFGRKVHARGAVIYAVGHREVAYWAEWGMDLSDLEGIQAVCDPQGEVVLTVYRNRDFSGLRDRRRGCHRPWQDAA